MKRLYILSLLCLSLTSCSSNSSIDMEQAFDIYYKSKYQKQDERLLKEYFTNEAIQDIYNQYLPIKPGKYEGSELILWEETEEIPYRIININSIKYNEVYVDIVQENNKVYVYRYTITYNKSNKITGITKTWFNEGGNNIVS